MQSGTWEGAVPAQNVWKAKLPDGFMLPQSPHLRVNGARSQRARFPNANPEAITLLQRMLVFHPGKRITVEDALAHPYLASLHDPSDEPLAHAEFSFDFERMPLTKQALRELLTAEMLCFHPDMLGPPGGDGNAAMED